MKRRGERGREGERERGREGGREIKRRAGGSRANFNASGLDGGGPCRQKSQRRALAPSCDVSVKLSAATVSVGWQAGGGRREAVVVGGKGGRGRVQVAPSRDLSVNQVPHSELNWQPENGRWPVSTSCASLSPTE